MRYLIVFVLILTACGKPHNGKDGASITGPAGPIGLTGNVGATGAQGIPGQDAPINPYDPVGLVDPCGTNPSIHNEVFIRLYNGLLLASFSDNINGYNTRFTVLSPGTFQTTDGDNCIFTVTNTYQIINENHHY